MLWIYLQRRLKRLQGQIKLTKLRVAESLNSPGQCL
jgi:hypothetical protein